MQLLGEWPPDLKPLPRLRARVDEAANWAATRFDARDPAHSLRQLLRPPTAFDLVSATLGAPVAEVATDRARSVGPIDGPRPGGRILTLDVFESLSDGAAEGESEGFFDVDNLPPCDTWIALVRFDDYPVRTRGVVNPLLLAWVPGAAMHWMERAFSVVPEQCLVWLDDLDPDLVAQLGV